VLTSPQINGYYRPRWALYFNYSTAAVASGKPFDQVRRAGAGYQR
jgi:hypothetical protein